MLRCLRSFTNLSSAASEGNPVTMSWRTILNQYPWAAIPVAGVVLFLSVVWLSWWTWPRGEGNRQLMAYFYDMNSKQLFTAPVNTPVPIETETGPYQGMPAGVRAHVYSCGPLLKDTEPFIGYLEIPTEAAPADQRPPGVTISEDSEEGRVLIRRPEDDRWHALESPEARAIMDAIYNRCGAKTRLNYVTPPPE